MPLSAQQQAHFTYIMNLTYGQYGCPWCKVQEIDTIPERLYERNRNLFEAYLSNPVLFTGKKQIIHLFLDDMLYNYTPESFMYLEMLKSEWMVSENAEHERVADKIVQRLLRRVEERKRQEKEDIEHYLTLWNLENIAAYHKASEELKEEIGLAHFLRNNGYGQQEENEDELWDYTHLKQVFLSKLFDKESLTFFVNVLPENIESMWETGKMPAIIGMDRHFIGIFWWMD